MSPPTPFAGGKCVLQLENTPYCDERLSASQCRVEVVTINLHSILPAAAVVDGTAAAHGRQQRRPMLRVAADSMMLNNATTRINK